VFSPFAFGLKEGLLLQTKGKRKTQENSGNKTWHQLFFHSCFIGAAPI
jgi:hypothetical protein